MELSLKVRITKHGLMPITVWLSWFVLLLFCLSLTVGSFQEFEPYAGKMFGFVTLLWALLSIFVVLWQRNRSRAPVEKDASNA